MITQCVYLVDVPASVTPRTGHPSFVCPIEKKKTGKRIIINTFQAQSGSALSSPQSALLPVQESVSGLSRWGELQLLCTFGQVDFQLAPVNQALVEVTDSIRV